VTTGTRSDPHAFFNTSVSSFPMIYLLNNIQSAAVSVRRNSTINFQLLNVQSFHGFFLTTNPGGNNNTGAVIPGVYSVNQSFSYIADPRGSGNTVIYYACTAVGHFFMGGPIFISDTPTAAPSSTAASNTASSSSSAIPRSSSAATNAVSSSSTGNGGSAGQTTDYLVMIITIMTVVSVIIAGL